MPDAVFTSQRRRRWLWRTLGLVGLGGAAAAGIWLILIVTRQSGQPGGAALFSAVGGFLAALAQVLLAWLQLRQDRRQEGEHLPVSERRERDARDRLRAHLGRQDRLRRMDDPATLALALRVHPSIDLPQPAPASAATSLTVARQPTGWRRLLPRGRHGQPGDAQSVDRDLPTFVDRDKGPQIREWMRVARDTGGFLLLGGDSSVGKTRLLYEAAREVLGDFTVLAPDLGDGELINKIAEATFPLPRLIVWLDELQRFLDGPYLTPGSTPITAAAVRRLLDAPSPVVIVGTLLPQYATQLRAGTLMRPRYPNAVDILDNRRLHCVSLDTFSSDERKAAARLASQDPRLAEALADRDYNVTEVLADAPTLVYRYENATQEQQAILHAAIDARHLGIHAPLPEQLLAAAARGYLTTVHPDNAWFPLALTELSADERPHDHATAPLIPVPNPDHSTVLGYTVADYLLQRLSRQRRSTHLSAVTWQALIDHPHTPDDLFRLAESAYHRLLYQYAEPLYRRLTAAGNERASDDLSRLLAQQGRTDEVIKLLQARADAGDGYADFKLAALLGGEQYHLPKACRAAPPPARFSGESEISAEIATTDRHSPRDWLRRRSRRMSDRRARADAGDEYAASQLVIHLARHSLLDELWAEVDAGTPGAAERLTALLAGVGEPRAGDRLRRFGLNPDGSIADGAAGSHQQP